jgi:signal transduction histidine kinase
VLHRADLGTSNGDALRELTIVDDGAGFDVDAVSAKGLGLISMRERLEPLGGTLEIHSRPGAGTRLKAFVPAASPSATMALTS